MIACIKTTCLPIALVCIFLMLALMTGCGPLRRPSVPPLPEQPVPTAPLPETPAPPAPVDPRYKASLQLTEQSRMLLTQKRYDDAIRTLEQAISLYSQNGESYYYMAEASLAKGSFKQAEEFNSLAAMYLKDPLWSSRINKQRRAIDSGNLPR